MPRAPVQKGGLSDAFRSVLGNKREYAGARAASGSAEAHVKRYVSAKRRERNQVGHDAGPVGGVAIIEAENTWDVFSAVGMWRAMRPGFFKMTKLAPAMTVQETIPREAELLKKLASS